MKRLSLTQISLPLSVNGHILLQISVQHHFFLPSDLLSAAEGAAFMTSISCSRSHITVAWHGMQCMQRLKIM